MRHLLFLSALAFLFAVASPSLAATQGPGPKIYNTYSATISGAAFTTQALNTAKAFDAINVGGYETVLVEVAYVYNSATHVRMTCLEGPTSAGAVFKVPEIDDAGLGVLDHYQRTWRWVTGGASGSFFFEVPVRYQWLTCSLIGTSAAAADTATVTIRAQE